MNACRSIVIFLLTVGLLTACADSIDDRLERAENHRAEGMLESAVADYRSILEEEPDHAEARFGLGETLLLAGDYPGAESALRRAGDSGISPHRVLPALADALLWQARYDAVLEDITPSRVDDAELRAQLLASRAMAHTGNGDMGAARRELEQAFDEHADNTRALVLAGDFAQQDGDMDAAMDHARRARESDDNSAAALLLSGRLQRMTGDRAASIESYRALMELGPTDISQSMFFNARGALVEQLAQAGEFEAAQEEVRLMLQQGRRHPYSNYLAAMLALNDDDLRTANDHLQTAISASPENVQVKALLGLLRIRQEQFAQATSLLQDVVFAQPENIRARIMLATAYRGVDQEQQATRVLAEGLPYAADDPQLVNALVQALDGDVEEFTRAIDRLSGPEDAVRRTRFAAAESLVGRGETGSAIDMLRNMDAEGDDELARRQFLVIAAMQGGDTDEALREAETIVDDFPEEPTAHNLLGGVQLTVRDFDAARDSFERAMELDPDDAQAHFNLGLLAGVQQDFDRAIGLFERGLELNPDNSTVMVQLSDLLRRQGRQSAALRWAERAASNDPNMLQAQMVLARQQIEMGDAEAALTPASRAVELNPDNAAAHGVLGVAHLEAGNAEPALDALRRATELQPEEPDLQFQLARALAANEDAEGTRETLRSLLAEHPDRNDARLVLARLDLQDGRAEEALDHALTLQESSSMFSHGLLLEGHARALLDDHEQAVRAFQAAVDEDRMEAMGPLVNSREALGEERPAQPLEDWLADNPDNTQPRFSLANWYIERGQYPSAIEHYETLVELTDGENGIVFNNLAWLYQQEGDDRALETAQEAHRLLPDNSDILDTLGWIHYDRGEYEEARTLLSRASEAAPDNAQTRYHYGAALIASGDTEAGERAINQALEMDPDAAWAEDARALLSDN